MQTIWENRTENVITKKKKNYREEGKKKDCH